MVGYMLEGKRLTDQRDAAAKNPPKKKDPPKIPASKGNPPAKSPVGTDKAKPSRGGPVNVQGFVDKGATNDALVDVCAGLLD
jgi:hypothetical protein